MKRNGNKKFFLKKSFQINKKTRKKQAWKGDFV